MDSPLSEIGVRISFSPRAEFPGDVVDAVGHAADNVGHAAKDVGKGAVDVAAEAGHKAVNAAAEGAGAAVGAAAGAAAVAKVAGKKAADTAGNVADAVDNALPPYKRLPRQLRSDWLTEPGQRLMGCGSTGEATEATADLGAEMTEMTETIIGGWVIPNSLNQLKLSTYYGMDSELLLTPIFLTAIRFCSQARSNIEPEGNAP